MALHRAGIEAPLRYLTQIRASQMNGCSFCLDMHVKEAKIAASASCACIMWRPWRESNLFSPRERAAFAWTETLTHLPREGVSEAAYAAAREQFSESELSGPDLRHHRHQWLEPLQRSLPAGAGRPPTHSMVSTRRG